MRMEELISYVVFADIGLSCHADGTSHRRTLFKSLEKRIQMDCLS